MFCLNYCINVKIITAVPKLKYIKTSNVNTILNCQKQNLLNAPLCRLKSSDNKKAVVKGDDTSGQVATFNEKVKQATKDVYYSGIVIAGIVITGALGYTIFRELFSSESPNGVYTNAFKLCKANNRVIDALGEPMKGFGELTARGRRRHVSHATFEQNGVQCMRMKFYIKGSRNQGTVHLEVRKNLKEKYEYRYLFVELDDYIKETIIIEDNR